MRQMKDVTPNEVIDLLLQAERILIAPSGPDGDSIGSSLAMQACLERLGKTVHVVSTEVLPDYLKFLPYTNRIEKSLGGSKELVIEIEATDLDFQQIRYERHEGKLQIILTPKGQTLRPDQIRLPQGSSSAFDLIMTVDTGDLQQLGKLYEENRQLFETTPLLNCDHHASNSHFGTHNFLDFSVSSTTQMLKPVIDELERRSGKRLMDPDVATLLLTGIITDTGSFQHSNTTPAAFEVAADLLDLGARQQEIIKHIFKTKSLSTLKLWGRVLSKLRYEEDVRLVYSTVTQKDLEETGADAEDTGGIIDELMSHAPQAEVVLLLKEKAPGFISGSLRAPGDLADVSEIAGLLGGGGHHKAAGFRIKDKTMEEALELCRQAILPVMRKKLGLPTEALFPNLNGAQGKAQTSIPVPGPGGEDLLLKDFRNRQGESSSQEPSSHKEMTVGDLLSQMGQ